METVYCFPTQSCPHLTGSQNEFIISGLESNADTPVSEFPFKVEKSILSGPGLTCSQRMIESRAFLQDE